MYIEHLYPFRFYLAVEDIEVDAYKSINILVSSRLRPEIKWKIILHENAFKPVKF